LRHSRRGFTIIELLTVIAILGLLATLAVPRYHVLKERAIIASMKTDLKNLATAQEAFFATHRDYAADAGPAEVPGPGASGVVLFRPSPGNTVVVTRRDGAGGQGWSATMTNPQVTDPNNDVCGIFAGVAAYAPNAAVTTANAPECY
jgi:type IV pilus assembly protein PilA